MNILIHITPSKSNSICQKACKFQGLSKSYKHSKSRNSIVPWPENVTTVASIDGTQAGPSRYFVSDEEDIVDTQNSEDDSDFMLCL